MKGIPLTRGYVALVDDEDYQRLADFRWSYCAAGNGYAVRYEKRDGRRVTIYLHREILRAEAGATVDHRNRNGLDCRRANLRLCTPRDNMRNRGVWGANRYKGVSNRGRRWYARIGGGNNKISLGSYDTAEEAALAYNAAAARLYGEFACLNAVSKAALPVEMAASRYYEFHKETD